MYNLYMHTRFAITARAAVECVNRAQSFDELDNSLKCEVYRGKGKKINDDRSISPTKHGAHHTPKR